MSVAAVRDRFESRGDYGADVTGTKPDLLPLANVLVSVRFLPSGFSSERLHRD
jgi:hypothetical protein